MWSDEPVTVIAFDVAGDLLAAGTAPYGGGGSVRVFDPGTGQPLTPPLRFEDPVTCLAFSPSGELLVVGTSREESSSGAFRVFASRSGDPRTPTVRLDGPTARVSFSRDETHVLGISRGGVARVLRLPPPLPFEEARGETNPMHTEWVDPTGTLVLSNAPGPREIETKGLFAWNPFTLERRRTPEIDAQLLAMRFEASDSLLLTTWSDEKLRLFSLPDLEPVGVPIPSEGKVVKMSLSPKGDLLLFTREGEIQSVDVARGERVSRLEIEGELGATLFAGTGEAVLIAQEAGSFSVGKSLLRWNPRTGVVEARFDAEEEMDRFFLSEDERTVLVVRDDAAFRALEAATLAPRGDWMDVPGYATIQAVSPDGERLLATDGPFVHQLLLSTGLPATPALEHAAEVRLVRYTDEGRRILTASADRSARLYSSATGLPTSPPFRLEAPVDHAALSPDRLLLVVSGGSSSTIFDARTAQRVTLSGQVPSGRNTRFSPDGSRLISHSGFDEFGSFWVCVLPDEKRPTLRLASLAALLSSRRFDVSSDLSLMTVKELEVAWQEAAISPPYGLGPRAEPKPRELTPDELDFLRSLPDRPSRVEDGR
jgi:WD40 repeat protein